MTGADWAFFSFLGVDSLVVLLACVWDWSLLASLAPAWRDLFLDDPLLLFLFLGTPWNCWWNISENKRFYFISYFIILTNNNVVKLLLKISFIISFSL